MGILDFANGIVPIINAMEPYIIPVVVVMFIGIFLRG